MTLLVILGVLLVVLIALVTASWALIMSGYSRTSAGAVRWAPYPPGRAGRLWRLLR